MQSKRWTWQWHIQAFFLFLCVYVREHSLDYWSVTLRICSTEPCHQERDTGANTEKKKNWEGEWGTYTENRKNKKDGTRITSAKLYREQMKYETKGHGGKRGAGRQKEVQWQRRSLPVCICVCVRDFFAFFCLSKEVSWDSFSVVVSFSYPLTCVHTGRCPVQPVFCWHYGPLSRPVGSDADRDRGK